MASKNFIVRDGFVVVLRLMTATKTAYDKVVQAGETVALDAETAAQHLHKLELVDAVDREAALLAEKSAAVVKHAASSSVDLVQTLVEALQHALTGAALASPAPPPATANDLPTPPTPSPSTK